ncbi:MAG: hypothetical protein HQK49_18735 [Oligoflexia bacterium]|nr:hypothetical protein [Oligoflexia bacterium]
MNKIFKCFPVLAFFVFLGSASLSLSVKALDFTKEDADKVFNQRDVGVEGLKIALKAADMYVQIANAESDTLNKAEGFIGQASALYFVGDNSVDNSEKIKYHLQAKEVALKAAALLEKKPGEALNESYSEPLARAYFWFGAALGKWGEANGIINSLFQVPSLKKYMQYIYDLGEEQVIEYGAPRILGRLLYKLPGIFGGDTKKSLEYLEKANNSSLCDAGDISRHSTNVVYYADTLISIGGEENKKKARKILEALVKKGESMESLNLYSPDLIAEAKRDIEIAKNTLKNL